MVQGLVKNEIHLYLAHFTAVPYTDVFDSTHQPTLSLFPCFFTLPVSFNPMCHQFYHRECIFIHLCQ